MRCWRPYAIAALACLLAACTAPVKPDSPQALPARLDLGRVAVVRANFQPDYVFKSSIGAKSDAAGWGAALGAGQCVEALRAGPLAGPFVVVCATVAAAMATIGAASTPGSPPATTIDAAEAQGQRALGALELQQGALEAMLRYGKAEGLNMGRLDWLGPQKQGDLPSYAEAKSVADTVIEVSVLDVRAQALELHKRPHIAMSMRVRVRLLSTRDGRQLDVIMLSVGAGAQTLDQWLAGEGRAMIASLESAIGTVAEWALDEVLLVYRPKETRPQDAPGPMDRVPPYALQAIEPPIRTKLLPEYGLAAVAVDSPQPEFRWEAWPRGFDMIPGSGPAQARDVRYHLRIYGQGGLTYERRGLSQAVHRLEISLPSCRRYAWTVRAQFTLNGTPRVTEWTGAYNTPTGHADPRWVRRVDSKPALALMPGSLLPFLPIFETPGVTGIPCPSR